MYKNPLGKSNFLTAVRRVLLITLFAASPVSWAYAQDASEAAKPADAAASTAPDIVPATGAGVVVPANTVVELETVDAVSSQTSNHGDFFKLRVAVDVKSGDTVLIPAGTPVVGQVVHAAKSGGGGKAGELILAARYVDLPQGQIKLRSSFGAAGKDRTGAALGVSMAVGMFGMFVHGKSLILPAGSPLSARIAVDTPIAAAP